MSTKQKKTLFVAAAIAVGVVCAAVFLVPSGRGAQTDVQEADESGRKGNDLLKAVPSDAVALSVGLPASEALQSDPAQVFIDLPLGALKDEQSVVSYHYQGELTPLVIMAAGKNGERPADLLKLEQKSSVLGFSHLFIPAQRKSQKPNLFIVSPSESLVAASRRNLEEKASVLDIESFRKALESVTPKTRAYFFKNDAIQHLLPNSALSRYVGRTVLCKFLSGASQWTVMKKEDSQPSGAGEYVTFGLVPVFSPGRSDYLGIFEKMEPGESKVAPLLPHKTSFVLDLPISSVEAWQSARTDWLDATSQLTQYNGQIRKVRRPGHPSPSEWAQKTGIKEVARVYWRGEQVLLVRLAKPAVSHNVKNNPTPGYLAPVFGSAFSIPDESKIACIGYWYIIGSEESVKHFLSAERKLVLNHWSEKSTKFVVLADDYMVYSGKQGMKLEVYKNY